MIAGEIGKLVDQGLDDPMAAAVRMNAIGRFGDVAAIDQSVVRTQLQGEPDSMRLVSGRSGGR